MNRILLLVICVLSLASSETCSKYSSEEATSMLRALNNFRTVLAKGEQTLGPLALPKAANMMKLEWDCDAAKAAQAWTDKCQFEHEENINYGENIYILSPTDDPLFTTNAVDHWKSKFETKEWLDLGNLTLNNNLEPKIRHAVQIGWGDSTTVGCGVSSCGSKNQTFVSCRFYITDAIMDMPMYIEGEPCSECPIGTHCENMALCTTEMTSTTKMTTTTKKRTFTKKRTTTKKTTTTTYEDDSGICSTLAETQAREMVELHNKYRSQIALGQFVAGTNMKPPKLNRFPKAANMRQLTWSCRLANEAQFWANRCTYYSSNITTKYGRNVHAYGANIIKEFRFIRQSVERWMNEYGFLGRGWIYSNNVTFTQEAYDTKTRAGSRMIWGETSKIGCSVNGCVNYPTLVICLYDTPEKQINHDMYRVGPTCSQCPQGTVCHRPTGLCVNK